MHSIYVDAEFGDDERRQNLFDGDLFVYSPRPSTPALTEFAGEMARQAFAPLDPETPQFDVAVKDYAALLAKLKPAFIHHPESKRLIQEMLVDFACDPEQVYFDVPRMRSSTSNDYLTTGIAFAFHPHRDTWYSRRDAGCLHRAADPVRLSRRQRLSDREQRAAAGLGRRGRGTLGPVTEAGEGWLPQLVQVRYAAGGSG